MVVNLPATRLNNEYVLASYGVLDLTTRLSDGEFGQGPVARRHTQHITDAVGEGGVGISRENDDISHHVGGMG